MLIKPVPCLEDNYAYLLFDEQQKVAAAVDPVQPEHITKALEHFPGYTLSAILTTHHHWDHAGGNDEMLKTYNVPCYGGSERFKGQTKIVKNGDTISIGSLNITAMVTPGHTLDHVCYLVEDKEKKAIFTGDCLFSSGCGKFFEGSPEDMLKSLTSIKNLSPQTEIYFGHEYTQNNLRFAELVEPDNEEIQEKIKWAKKVGCTTPSTVGNEIQTNPFLRFDNATVRDHVNCHGSDSDVLAAIRKKKDDM